MCLDLNIENQKNELIVQFFDFSQSFQKLLIAGPQNHLYLLIICVKLVVLKF